MHADFIVIGAGIAGAGVAFELSSTAKVVVLEGEAQPGFHSTGRSAALFSTIYGNETVRALSRASRDFFNSPPPGFTDHPLLQPRGTLYIAQDSDTAVFDALSAAPDVQQLTRRLTAAEVSSLVPILKAHWTQRALYEEGAQDMEVHAIHQGYLRGLKQRGAELKTNALVTGIERVGDSWRVLAGDETYTAPVLINAAGAWADEVAALAGVACIGLEPRRRTALLVDPPANVQSAGWPMVFDVADTFYFKPDAGKLLLSPADETPNPPEDVQPEELDVAIAVDRVEQATTMTITRVHHQWAGLRSFVADRSPVIGFDPDAEGFFWLAAQGGYGIQSAPAASQLAAALALRAPPPQERDFAGLVEAVSPARPGLRP